MIPWPPDTAYVTTDRHVLYGDQPDGETTGEHELAVLDPPPEYAVITSQTCDIDEQGLPRRSRGSSTRLCSWSRTTRGSG